MMPVIFDICKGAIPGSARFFPYAQIVKGTCLALGGAAVLPTLVKEILKKLPSTNEENWQVYRLIPSSVPLRYRKIVVGGAALVLTACMMGAVYPYLQVFLSLPYPKSFVLRFSEWTPHSVTVIAAVVVLVGKNIICPCFGIQVTCSGVYVSCDSLTSLERLRARSFGPKNQIWRPNLPVQVQAVGWASLPGEILRTHIFPHVVNETKNFKVFFTLGQVCLAWRVHLLHPDCLVPSPPYQHFLWKAFRYQKFDPIEVAAFFEKYLPKDHQGERLRLPLRFLNCLPENSLTARQLGYIFTRFPKASIDSVALRLDSKDDVEEVARLLNICLEPRRELSCLTIIPERFINENEAALYGKLLSKDEYQERYCFFELNFQPNYYEYQGPKQGYPAQVMKLLPLLEGKVSFLRIDFERAEGDKDLDSVPIVQLFHPSFRTPLLSVGRLDLIHDGRVQDPPHKDLEKINVLIKNNGSEIHCSPPHPDQSLIDDTRLVKDDADHSLESKFRKAMFLAWGNIDPAI
jgi:hypothetical protein